jgi:hypothetical protein
MSDLILLPVKAIFYCRHCEALKTGIFEFCQEPGGGRLFAKSAAALPSAFQGM